jgi:LuxR family maltose regulon positive regulatory protein
MGTLLIESQLLATKLFVPIAPGTLISRPRLDDLLHQGLEHPLTLISAPAGFVLAALDMQQPALFTPLLKYLQSPQAPPLMYVLTLLINLLMDTTQHFVLILDDYHVITEQEIHNALTYLIEHLPAHMHIILATRTDPALPLPRLRIRQQMLEVRTDQLRCTAEEIRAFFQEVMDTKLPDDTIQEVTARTEGWLVGLQLLGLSLQGRINPVNLLADLSGDQRYILDYLTEEVLHRQSQEIQTFLLSTCILQRLNASLCDYVTQQHGSQEILKWLEQANLFVVSLDDKRDWYRYHALFAEALRYRLEQTYSNLVPTLHHRASIWYAEHCYTTEAILHAFSAHQWHWAADLIEHMPSMMSLTWGVGEHELVTLRHWLEQLPRDVVRSRPRLCLASAQHLWMITLPTMLEGWLDCAEAALTTSPIEAIDTDTPDPILIPQTREEQANLLGEVIAFRALVRSYQENGETALPLCQQALALLSAENYLVRTQVACAQFWAYYTSTANDAVAAIQSGLQAISLAQATEQTTLILAIMSSTVLHMIGTGQLHEAQRLTLQGVRLGTQSEEFMVPAVGWPILLQADLLREWNQLDAALTLVEEAISLCKQTESSISLFYSLCGYAVLLRISLSRGKLDTARYALQKFESISLNIDKDLDNYVRSHFTTVDQVRFWLASEDLDRAICWAEELDIRGQHSTPFAHERAEVARVRLLLAKDQPDLALERLEPILARATTGQRWDHVIEIRLLQALAHQMRQEMTQALEALSDAVRLAEPEGYIRRFVDEGVPMAALLNKLRKQQGKDRPTPYLDTLLAAFPQQSKTQKCRSKRVREHNMKRRKSLS